MNKKLCEATELLSSTKSSCVILWEDNEEPFLSTDIGIKPLMVWLRKDKQAFEGAVIADRVIGKAAALMTILGGAKAVYGEVMSEAAKNVLERYQVEFGYGSLVPFIENRTHTGQCPLEEAVVHIDEIENAFDVLEAKIKELMESHK